MTASPSSATTHPGSRDDVETQRESTPAGKANAAAAGEGLDRQLLGAGGAMRGQRRTIVRAEAV